MKTKALHFFLTVIAAIAVQDALKAQTAAFLTITPDPVAMSMGGTGTVLEATPFTMWNNAAASALDESKFQAAASYSLWQPSYSANNIASVAGYGRVAEFMTVSAGVRYFSHRPYDVTDGTTGTVTGTFSPVDIQAGIGLGFRILPILSLGANINYVYSHIGGPQAGNAVSADFGALLDLRFIKVGLTASNIGSRLNYGGASSYALPANISLGVGTEQYFGADDRHALAVNLQGGTLLESPAFFAGVGAQYCYNGLVRVSAGYHYGEPDKSVIGQYVSVGAGVKVLGISIDAAYLIGTSADSPIGNSFSVGIGYAF